MKTEGNDIDRHNGNRNNHNNNNISTGYSIDISQRVHSQKGRNAITQHTLHCREEDNEEDDDTIENFEEALQDGSDVDDSDVARLEDD